MPQSGTLTLWEPAARARVEHALESGVEISPHYDSMIAKFVASGATREEARRKLFAALEDTAALGVPTNQAFLARCLEHPEFVAGEATTGFIARHGEALLAADPVVTARARALAAVLLYATASPDDAAESSAMSHRLPVGLRFAADDQPCVATLVRQDASRYGVTLGDDRHDVQVLELDRNRVRFSFDGLVERAALARDGGALLLDYRGIVYRIEDRTHTAATRTSAAGGDGKIRASMSGRVVAVHVSVGDRVKQGQSLLTLEAMKMEHAHVAPVGGTVTALYAALGDQVPAYRIVAEIEMAALDPA
jgi:geranyl-CoA carboxylase alpha subunit